VEATVREQLQNWFQKGLLGRIVYTCEQQLQSGPLPAEERAEWLFWLGKVWMKSGPAEYGRAKACLKEAIPLARRHPALQAKLMTTLSALYTLTADAPAAETLLTQFRGLARSRPGAVRPLLGGILYNVGIACERVKRTRAARDYYREAAETIERHGLDPSLGAPADLLGRAIHNLGGMELKLGNLTRAREAMERAEALQPDERYGHKKLSRLAEFHLVSGDLQEAQQLVTAALTHERVDDFTRADLYYTWARILSGLRREGKAREKALTALDYAVRSAHYALIHDINLFLRPAVES
jgi:tetratricopeptide (TPR) repeat protein